MIVDRRESTKECARVSFDQNMKLTDFVEKPAKYKSLSYVNSGFYIFQTNFLLN